MLLLLLLLFLLLFSKIQESYIPPKPRNPQTSPGDTRSQRQRHILGKGLVGLAVRSRDKPRFKLHYRNDYVWLLHVGLLAHYLENCIKSYLGKHTISTFYSYTFIEGLRDLVAGWFEVRASGHRAWSFSAASLLVLVCSLSRVWY